MKIFFAEPNDCDEIIQLQKLAYQTEAQIYQNWSLPPLTQTPEDLRKEFPNLLILKAVQEEKIIGSVRAQLITDICHIGRLIVHPDFQKQGIGTELLRRIEQEFSTVSAYELFTGSKSHANIRFYLANGYKVS